MVFDLGGGTLDVAIAERISGKGKFFGERRLEENYFLPEDWQTLNEYKLLKSLSTYLKLFLDEAAEKIFRAIFRRRDEILPRALIGLLMLVIL